MIQRAVSQIGLSHRPQWNNRSLDSDSICGVPSVELPLSACEGGVFCFVHYPLAHISLKVDMANSCVPECSCFPSLSWCVCVSEEGERGPFYPIGSL